MLAKPVVGQDYEVNLVNSHDGFSLEVNAKNLAVNGINWDYIPIGENYDYDFWDECDHYIEMVLDQEMNLLKKMGVNTIRHYIGVPPEWIEYIYSEFGIHTILNHPLGRYGHNLNNHWVKITNYQDEQARNILLNEIEQMAIRYKGTKGLLMYLLGNENNYGLHWKGAETQNSPKEEIKLDQAKGLYTLHNQAAKIIKKIEPHKLTSICNGDLLYLDMMTSLCVDIDIIGANVYRGKSFDNLFARLKNKVNKAFLLTEFGSDVLDNNTKLENQYEQADYLKSNWLEIYSNFSGKGLSGNCIGGLTFQFSDGWWKHGQTKNLDVHDLAASWSNGGYKFDYIEGENNMNEEWFGVCAKKINDDDGITNSIPRAAYYVLQEIHAIDIYNEMISLKDLKKLFDKIDISEAVKKAGNHPKDQTLNSNGSHSKSSAPMQNK